LIKGEGKMNILNEGKRKRGEEKERQREENLINKRGRKKERKREWTCYRHVV
jgi:hypothetical protein